MLGRKWKPHYFNSLELSPVQSPSTEQEAGKVEEGKRKKKKKTSHSADARLRKEKDHADKKGKRRADYDKDNKDDEDQLFDRVDVRLSFA